MLSRASLVGPALLIGLLPLRPLPAHLAQEPAPAIVGRWDLTIHAADGDYPSWLEVQPSGVATLVGQFVGRVGSARPISRIDFAHDTVRFAVPPQWERRSTDLEFEGRLQDGRLDGWTTDTAGVRLPWTATRAPTLRRTGVPVWGRPVSLIAPELKGWRPSAASHWSVVGGILRNAQAGDNLVTTQVYRDFKLHLEFRYPKGGNSGVYLRGRYEVQVEDSGGLEPATDHLGGIYGFIAPTYDAAKEAGEWQAYDITLVGRIVTVVLNGTRVICDREIPGITGGALDSDEASPGPLFLQGDHGPIEYRNVVLTPAR